MLLSIAICDDELSEIKRINDYLLKFSVKNDIDFKVYRFSSGEELIESYKGNQSKYDIIYMDVEMPGLSGIETAEKIRGLPDRNVLIAFITSYPEYMQDSFDVQASQYLTKPLSYELFEEKTEKLISYLKELEINITVVSLKSGEIILHLDNIICFESVKTTTTRSDLLVTTVDEEFMIKGKIGEMESKLKEQHFISVHRSVLVNMRFIKKFNSNTVFLTNGKEVDVSRRRLSKIKESFSKYIVMRYKK